MPKLVQGRVKKECTYCGKNNTTYRIRHEGEEPGDVPNEYLLAICKPCWNRHHSNRSIIIFGLIALAVIGTLIVLASQL